MLDADAEWREATTWRTRAAELQRDVTTRAWSADLQPELQRDVVPLMLLEVLHDALREGPFWCEAGVPQRHCAVGILQVMHSGRPLDKELRARGRLVPKQALHDQRAALEASVYNNRFCQVHARVAIRAGVGVQSTWSQNIDENRVVSMRTRRFFALRFTGR